MLNTRLQASRLGAAGFSGKPPLIQLCQATKLTVHCTQRSFAPDAKAKVQAKKDAKIKGKQTRVKFAPSDGQTDYWELVAEGLLSLYTQYGSNMDSPEWVECVEKPDALFVVLICS